LLFNSANICFAHRCPIVFLSSFSEQLPSNGINPQNQQQRNPRGWTLTGDSSQVSYMKGVCFDCLSLSHLIWCFPIFFFCRFLLHSLNAERKLGTVSFSYRLYTFITFLFGSGLPVFLPSRCVFFSTNHAVFSFLHCFFLNRRHSPNSH